MSVRRRRRALILVLVVALVAGTLLGYPSAPQRDVGTAHPIAAGLFSNDPCPLPQLAQNYSGTVTIANSTIVPIVTVTYSFYETVTEYLEGSGAVGATCVAASGNVTSNSDGAFNFSILTAVDKTCGPWPGHGTLCNITTGPYVAVNVTPPATDPAGLVPTVAQNGTAFRIEYYPDLTSIRLVPGGTSATYSTDAVDPVRAEAIGAFGDPSGLDPDFDWSLSGAGWALVNPSDGPVANVTAAAGAGLGNLSVVATFASVAGPLATPRIGLALLAVPTTITLASLNRTNVDAGGSIDLTVNGSGSAGYNYSASVAPGLGLPSTPLACEARSGTGQSVQLSCTTVLRYPSAGTAQPVVTLSNGNSSAAWQLPDVSVEPLPTLSIVPNAPAGYVNQTIAVEVDASSGTEPYGMACLTTGIAPLECDDTPGPTWTFDVRSSSVGNYTVRTWAIDATGVNRSATALLRIADPLALVGISAPANGSAGIALPLTATVVGGILPARAWWNATGLSTPFATGPVRADGPLQATFVPPSVGFTTLSLTLVDSLGTVVEATASVSIAIGPASSIVPLSRSSTVPPRAGAAISLSWQATDPAGIAVPTFASPAEIVLDLEGSGHTAPGWVNDSALGPLPSPVVGWFNVPAAAWLNGMLNVTVTSELAGTLDVGLTVAAPLPTPTSPVAVVVGPDVDHLRLFDPSAALSGARASDTLWQVVDRFGNPADGAEIVVTSSFAGVTEVVDSPTFVERGGGTAVWVNYSAIGAGAGWVTVTDLAGDAVVPPIGVPAAPGPFAGVETLLPLLAGGCAGTLLGVGVWRRRRRTGDTTVASDGEDEAGLRRLAEGRATVVDLVRQAGAIDLGTLGAAWRPSPRPPELADWVASLVTDGTLGARIGPDGVARFCLASEGPTVPEVVVDQAAFDRAELVRAEATRDGEEGSG